MNASALSQLKTGIGRETVLWEAAGNTEVSHAEEVYCPLIQARTQHVAGGCQEAQRRRPEGATCPSSVESRRGRSGLERQADRRSLRLSTADGRVDPPTICGNWFPGDSGGEEACQSAHREVARWRAGGEGYRHPPWATTERLRQLDASVACPQGCRVRNCRCGQLRNGAAYAQKKG
jgi:hypothetical protein